MKPNIVIVMTDQQRMDLRAGCGYPLDTMPYLDSFARAGTDFRRAYTPNPVCLPARCSMFTGRYASCHKVRTNHNLRDICYSEDLIDVLRHAGYKTALCGKNHTYRKPEDFDFCERTGHLAGGGETNTTPDEIAFADFLKSTRHMEMHEPSPGGVEVQHPYRNVSSALRFLDETPREQPFFLWLSFAEPHNPYQVPVPYFDMFPPSSLPPLGSSAAECEKRGGTWLWERRCWEKVLGPDIDARIDRARSNYHGMLRLIDDQFRRFMEGLDQRGLRDNTLVIFLSDHGDFAGEYGLLRKGVELPEVLCHITMAAQGPDVGCGVLDDTHYVSLVDILPTVCDLIGEDIPFGCQGHSILPLLLGGSYPAHEYDTAYAEFGHGGLYWTEEDELTTAADRCLTDGKTFACISSWTSSGSIRMLRKGDWKIVMDMEGNGKLYRIASDPLELRDLWNDPDAAGKKTEMLVSLCAAILESEDPIPAPHNRYRTKTHPKGFRRDTSYRAPDPGVRAEGVEEALHRKGQ